MKNCLSFQKYAVSERVVVWISYYGEVLSEYANKSGDLEKSEVWNWRSLIVPLIPCECEHHVKLRCVHCVELFHNGIANCVSKYFIILIQFCQLLTDLQMCFGNDERKSIIAKQVLHSTQFCLEPLFKCLWNPLWNFPKSYVTIKVTQLSI